MRLPQITFSLEESYTTMLKTIASAYGLSVSAYVGSILTRIIKDEVVDLGIPLDKILGKEEFADFKQNMEESYYISKNFAPKHLQESEAEYYRFRMYVLEGKSSPSANVFASSNTNSALYLKQGSQQSAVTTDTSYPVRHEQSQSSIQTTALTDFTAKTYSEPSQCVKEFEAQEQAECLPVVDIQPANTLESSPKKKHRIGGLR